MAWYYEAGFYAAVVTNLLAGDVQARRVSNDQAIAVEVRLEDGTRVLWSNAGHWWAYTSVGPDGSTDGRVATLGWDAPPDSVATLIATFEYGARIESAAG